MTDYQYTVQFKGIVTRAQWELSGCVQNEWKDSIKELISDLKPREVADEGSYRIVRRPTDELEVMG